ncbi:response regulator [Kibdelosporangium phytohabitans]|uniref:LuxR family transcriptional regulator n=1 Tax=Kibdelosporangium phytohabitans TaxID=860235 RepID=A0A0N9I8R5_9PSEU|nr:response regulator transcription factor [Kibdelosporangium phytohabitans]ALG11288.1 LuxR family transcriptional regulator [Kibdelosporangium phytohabitans]MBE1462579.1 DNA-binding NarL/FixJ family response regulator [Kibdelosporangium phytohabitans]
MINVLVVDDDPLVCGHLRTILGAAEDVTVVAEAYDGADAVEAVLRHKPDVVLMDLHMPGVDGLTAIQRISELDKPPVLVALTTFDGDNHVLRAMRNGAAGYLLKSTPPKDLIGLVRVAADGHTVMSPAVSRNLVAHAAGRRSSTSELLRDLTGRESEILACLGNGLSNAQIADRVHLSEGTVKNYISQILLKLRCANRTQAGLLAYEAGLCQ